MTKIKTLQVFYKEKGIGELKRVLSDFITITEKIDAHRFSFVKKKDSIYFFGKHGNKHLSLIDRAISNLYEPAINYILSIDKNIIPENIRFGCYYISPDFFLNVKYKKHPKHNLVLTDLKIYPDIVVNPKKINHYADKFEIDAANILFHGKLTNKLRTELLKFAQTDSKNYNEFIFNTFPKFKPLLGKDLNDVTEGFIIRSLYKKYTYIQIKEDDNVIEIQKTNSNIFELLLLDILYFMKNFNFFDVKLETNNIEIKYIEFMSIAFNEFIKKNGNMLLDSNIQQPEFLKKSGNLSKRYFSNKDTLKFIENETFKYILRVFITTFNNVRKPRGLINESTANEFNIMTDKIKQYITKNNVIDFMEFKEYIK